MKDDVAKTVAGLNSKLYERIASFPQAKTEIADFHFKDTVENYVTAITSFTGEKLVLTAPNSLEAAAAIRRAVLLSDLVVFTVTSHIGHPALALFPIGDDVASPVLGTPSCLDLATGGRRLLTPQEYMSMKIMTEPASSSVVAQLLGRPFNSADEPAWHRTVFSVTSQGFVNARGEKCHIAGGPIHVQLPKDDQLLEDAEHLMRKGRLAYAPFLSLPNSLEDVSEGALKAEVIRSGLAVWGGPVKTKTASDVVLELQVPYLENVPLSILSKILDDESESIAAFRRELRRAIEDIESAEDRADVERRITKLKRDVLEDELEKVRLICNRIARMNSIARIGAYVGVGSLAVAAFYGLSAAGAITGTAGVAAAALSTLWRNYEETRDKRRSPMHFVWCLGRRAPSGM